MLVLGNKGDEAGPLFVLLDGRILFRLSQLPNTFAAAEPPLQDPERGIPEGFSRIGACCILRTVLDVHCPQEPKERRDEFAVCLK